MIETKRSRVASVDARDVVERHWPYDGPHDDEALAGAAEAVERLTRYLANATHHPRLEFPGPTLFRTVSNLAGALSHLDQVLEQVSAYATGPMSEDATLYDDRRDRPGADTASDMAVALECARDELRRGAAQLALACRSGVHLGHDEAVDTRTCWLPGDQEHDHAMCEDVVAEQQEEWERELLASHGPTPDPVPAVYPADPDDQPDVSRYAGDGWITYHTRSNPRWRTRPVRKPRGAVAR